MWILIRWLLTKPSDLDLQCLQKKDKSGSAGQGLSQKCNINTLNFDQKAYFLIVFYRKIDGMVH